MKTFFDHWMPILAHYRLALLIGAFAVLGCGLYLMQPTVPSEIFPVLYRPPTQSLHMAPPHTLVWTTENITHFLDVHSFVVQTRLIHQQPFRIEITPTANSLVAISQDGKWFAIATSKEIPGELVTREGAIEIWSLSTQQLVTQIPFSLTNPPQLWSCVTISPDGQQVGWIVRGNGSRYLGVSVWDQGSQTISYQYQDDDPQGLPNASLLLQSAEPMLIRSSQRVLDHYLGTEMQLHYQLTGLTDGTIRCMQSPDGSLLLGESETGITIRRTMNGQLLQRLPALKQPWFWENQSWNMTSAFSTDNRYLLTASYAQGDASMGIFPPPPSQVPALLWDIQTGQIVQRFDVQPNGARMVAYSPDGQYIATYGRNGHEGEIRVFRVQPQPPYLQPACLIIGLVLLLLGVVLPWVWVRR